MNQAEKKFLWWLIVAGAFVGAFVLFALVYTRDVGMIRNLP